MGIPTNIIDSGFTAVLTYATEKGIDISTVKKQIIELSQNSSKEVSNPNKDFENQLLLFGIPKDVIAQGKDAVTAYAAKNNIKLPTPPNNGIQFNQKV